MNALTLLKQDHGNVEALFERFEQAPADDARSKREIVDKLIEHLSVHATVEEQIFYPAVRSLVPAENDVVLEALEEHHVTKLTLSELEKLPATAERFDAKVRVLIESVRRHVQEEEDELFPAVRDTLSNEQLIEIGETMERAKQTAPTRPHPFTPDVPPWNMLVGLPVSLLDRAITTSRDVIEKVLQRRSA